jgi:hypothetical protein
MSSIRGVGGSFSATGSLQARVAVGHEEKRRTIRSTRLGSGTLACGRCDAPIAIGPGALPIGAELICPYCDHRGPVREFLSLAAPTRPARVTVRVRLRAGSLG